MSRLAILTLAPLYLFLSGIYWLPGISPAALSTFKTSLYLIILLLGLTATPRLTPNTKSILTLLALTAGLAFISNTLSEGVATAAKQATDFLEPFFWLLALSGLKTADIGRFINALRVSMAIFLPFLLYPILVYADFLPNQEAPSELIDLTSVSITEMDHWLTKSSILGGGFAGQSTTWGVIVAMYSVFLASLVTQAPTHPFLRSTIAIGVLFCGLASTAVTSSRGGTLTILAVGLYGFISTRGLKKLHIFLLTLIGASFFTIALPQLLADDFFRGLDGGASALDMLNNATTGRTLTFIFALDAFLSSPIVGVGPNAAVHGMTQLQVHNTYLRILAESGLLVFLPTLFLCTNILRNAAKPNRAPLSKPALQSHALPNGNLVLLAGYVLALAEPNVMFGTFNANAVFWTAVWLTCQRGKPLTTKASGHEASPSQPERILPAPKRFESSKHAI